MKALAIVKIGGSIIDDAAQLSTFLKNFSGLGGHKILVHGGGSQASRLADELHLKTEMVDGRRVTDLENLRVVTMIYGGLISKNIVAGLQAASCNAIGLSGADANLIRAMRRPVLKVVDQIGEEKELDYGYAGDLTPNSVNRDQLRALLEMQLVPVFSAITHNGQGQLLNTNADTIASAIAVAMANFYEVSLIYCFEKKGVLADVANEDSVIQTIDQKRFADLKVEGLISKGMLPKLQNAFSAIENGVKEVLIGKAEELEELLKQKSGTRLIKQDDGK